MAQSASWAAGRRKTRATGWRIGSRSGSDDIHPGASKGTPRLSSASRGEGSRNVLVNMSGDPVTPMTLATSTARLLEYRVKSIDNVTERWSIPQLIMLPKGRLLGGLTRD